MKTSSRDTWLASRFPEHFFFSVHGEDVFMTVYVGFFVMVLDLFFLELPYYIS